MIIGKRKDKKDKKDKDKGYAALGGESSDEARYAFSYCIKCFFLSLIKPPDYIPHYPKAKNN